VSYEVQSSLYCHLSGSFFVTTLLALVLRSSSVVLSLRHKNPMESFPIKQSLLSCLFSLLFDHLIVCFCLIKGSSAVIQVLLF